MEYLVSDAKLGVLPLVERDRIVDWVSGLQKMRDLQGLLEVFIDFHDGSLIATSITVIWGREYSNDILILRPIVSLVY